MHFRDVMHSPLSFFIFVMSTFFCAVLIPGIFRTPRPKLYNFWQYPSVAGLFVSSVGQSFAEMDFERGTQSESRGVSDGLPSWLRS